MRTRRNTAAQSPYASIAIRSCPNAYATSSDRRAKALGEVLSPPRPVPAGNVMAALRMVLATMGAGTGEPVGSTKPS